MWLRTLPQWMTHLATVRAMVTGRDPWRPCPGQSPMSWDGVRWRDQVEERGFTVLDCEPPYVTRAGAEGLHNLAVVR